MDQALEQLQSDDIEGWYVRSSDANPERDAMELIDDHGLVPESQWSFKFQSRATAQRFKSTLITAFRDVLASNRIINTDVLDQVLTTRGVFPSKPPIEVDANGTKIPAKEYASRILNFNSRDYVSI